jgi:nicotinate-nucleotide adenylyltransferase
MKSTRTHGAIGILGGSFDPPHLGHLIIARDALEQLGLQSVKLIPAWQSPLRDSDHAVPFEKRLELCRRLATGRPWLEALDVEASLPRPSYTINTVRELKKIYPGQQLVWIIGADQYVKLDQWKDIADLSQLVDFAVATRPGSQLPGEGERTYAAHILRPRAIDISSTEIRERAKSHLPIDMYTTAEVVDYIGDQRLYG